jgi:hypothetical protein
VDGSAARLAEVDPEKARRHGIDVRGYLVSERPPANSTLWRELGVDVGIVVTWPERFYLDVPQP